MTNMENGGGQLFGLLLAFIIFVPWGWVKLNKKNRGWGYYVLLILWPLIGFIVACCLGKKEKNVEQAPNNDITNVQ